MNITDQTNTSEEKLKESIKLLKSEIEANQKKMTDLKWETAEKAARLRKLEKLVEAPKEQE